MPLGQHELFGDVVERCVFMKDGGVFGVKRLGHVQAIEPHLRRIDLLVPKAAFRGARVRPELRAQQTGRLPVFVLFRILIKKQEHSAQLDIIQIVLIDAISPDRAVIGNVTIHGGANVIEVLLISRLLPDALHALQDHALLVTPASRALGRLAGIIRPVGDDRVGKLRCQRSILSGGRRGCEDE
jgi:hypothetical protein